MILVCSDGERPLQKRAKLHLKKGVENIWLQCDTNPSKMSGTEFLLVSSVSRCSHKIHGAPHLYITFT